jgi:hypothetical protein
MNSETKSPATQTWPLASYQKPERRALKVERRKDTRRAAVGDRREGEKRSLRSLLRF